MISIRRINVHFNLGSFYNTGYFSFFWLSSICQIASAEIFLRREEREREGGREREDKRSRLSQRHIGPVPILLLLLAPV